MAQHEIVYAARATAYGDGRGGHVTSDDDVLDLDLAVPVEMGGTGGDLTNPEQMFAAGYAACFHGALKRAGSQAKADLTGSTVTATVGLGRRGAGFGLSVALRIAAPALSYEQAAELVALAHERCPYSNATRGNIPVTVEVHRRRPAKRDQDE
ncbi:MAG: Ohr family peroxiredoxin [Actinomycetia bacterium]|nr:Ohr family peroxiredoxin [Actinomycetes bacterium]